MSKQCQCGKTMNIQMRTVIFASKVEIENVPIYSCDTCSRSEVYPKVKTELTSLIDKLGKAPEKQHVFFDEVNELAHLMHQVTRKEKIAIPVEQIIEERINQLLDLLLLAGSLDDAQWAEDIRGRLQQITRHTFAPQDFS